MRFDVAQLTGLGLEVFTTRIDTIYGVSAVLISANHPDLEKLLEGVPGAPAMQEQLKSMRAKSVRAADIATAEKEGFFTGRFAVNPFSGESVPIWVANFVLAEYGTGAVMCVPAHDQRDLRIRGKISPAGEDRDSAGAGHAVARRSDERGVHRVRAARSTRGRTRA